MGPPSYMRFVVDRTVVMRRIPVFIYLFIYLFILFGSFNDYQYTHHTTPKSKINEIRTGKKCTKKWSSSDYRTLSRFCQERLEKPMKKSLSEQLVSWPTVEPVTFYIQMGIVIVWANRSVVSVPHKPYWDVIYKIAIYESLNFPTHPAL